MSPSPEAGTPSDSASGSGWHASLDLRFAQRNGRTLLSHKRQRGPLTVQRPFYPEGGVCHLYLLHPPGGVVGGDRLDIDLTLEEGAHALLTTPGAAKFYRSAGPEARVQQRLRVHDGAVLEWFPQENILFSGALLSSRTELYLNGGAGFLGWEIQCLGRPVIGERFDTGAADLGVSIHRDGRLLLIERLRLRSVADLDGVAGLRGYPVSATFIASGARDLDLNAARDGLGGRFADPFSMTLLDDLLVARCLSSSVEPVQRLFIALWGILRPRLLGCEACPPRIWAT